ncbi:MAG: hypothetical protein ABR551_09890 [Gemmatimonadales bacterium]
MAASSYTWTAESYRWPAMDGAAATILPDPVGFKTETRWVVNDRTHPSSGLTPETRTHL